MRTLRGKLAGLIVLIIVLSLGTSWLLVSRDMERQITELTTADLARDAAVLREELKWNGENGFPPHVSQETLARWSDLLGVRITLIDSKGVVVQDSDVSSEELSGLDNHRDRPEVRMALATGVGVDRRYSETTRIPYLYYAISLTGAGDIAPQVLRCSLPLSQYDLLLSRVRTHISFGLLASGLIGLCAGFVGLRRVTRPILALTRAVQRGEAVAPNAHGAGGSQEIEALSLALQQSAEARRKMLELLEEERNQLSAVVSAAPCGLMLIAAHGTVVRVNEAFEPLLRMPFPRAVGMRPGDVLRIPELVDLLAAATVGDFGETSFAFHHGEAERYYEAHAVQAGADDILVVLIDTTERKRAEEARKRFVADAGHEFQTPLSSISVAAELLLGMDRSDAAEREPYIREIMRQRERMTALVDDLLLLSRLESGVPTAAPENFDLSRVLAMQVGEAQANPRAARISWKTDLPDGIFFTGRLEALRRSVANLLDNAVKYTYRRYGDGAGGEIHVSLRKEKEKIVLRVADNGIGIPSSSATRIFRRFERVDRDRKREEDGVGGYGLGLAIVKHAVESHGGSITVENSDGRTIFTMVLPL